MFMVMTGGFKVSIPLMVLVTLPAIDGLKPSWREASSNLGGTTWTYWRRVGLPVLAPSLLGGFLLLFANSFSAYATAYALATALLEQKINPGDVVEIDWDGHEFTFNPARSQAVPV